MSVTRGMPTLPGRDYHAADVFELEREQVFARSWFYAGRAESLKEPGDFVTVDVADESVIVLRAKDGEIHAFYNVCRHRGSRLCEQPSGRMKGAVKCPYHAWSYSFDGKLIGTPMVDRDEIDRESLGLWPVPVDVWQGFLFVHLDPDPVPLEEALRDQHEQPLTMARFGLDRLRIGHTTVSEVEANWKILIDNYNECLHCPTVHPELVAVVPTFRAGASYDPTRTDGGVSLADGRTAMVTAPRLRLPLLPGFKGQGDPEAYYGALVYPTMFLDVDGSTCLATAVFPTGPQSCRLVTEYLFNPDALEDPDFDPTPVVEFNELVTRQDNEACERVQRGVTSRAFDHGVFPAKDAWVFGFDERYRRDVEG